jgi:hypothetical protein
MRTFSKGLYGVPPDHVIGSRIAKSLVIVDGKTALRRDAEIDTINDKDQKPIGIDRVIGKRPIFAAGNVGTGGDIWMLRYTHDRHGLTFTMVIHHDDAEREFAYEEKDGATLDAAREFGFAVVSMKNDWKTIFGIQ